MLRDIVLHPKFLPTVQTIVSALAFVRYCYAGDLGRSVYWGAAAAITYSVTWMIK